jgi:formylglycine-generating enzyme required for sulfatase activity
MLRHVALGLALASFTPPTYHIAKRALVPRIDVVPIPAGSFIMGSDVEPDERPAHRVAITQAFSIGKYEITQEQWLAVMGRNPSQFEGADLPIDRVTWGEAVEFCRRLSSMTGKTYRLPTEAEWEYACRAGSDGRWCFGDGDADLEQYAWFEDNGRRQSHPVGRLRANGWGVYDMHGNVWEWCSDWYDAVYYNASPASDPRGPRTGENRVLRGGSYGSVAPGCRSANRFFATPDQRYFASGLRVVLEGR